MADAARRTQGVVAASTLFQAGVSRSALSRAVLSGAVQRVRPRVYSLAPLPALARCLVADRGVDPAFVTHVRAALLSLGPSTWAGGRTAAALFGWGMLVEPRRMLDLGGPHGRTDPKAHGVRWRQERSHDTILCRVLPGTDPIQLSGPVRTVIDCSTELPLLEAVVICDSALRAGAVTVEGLLEAAHRLPGRKGADRARRVISLCDPAAGSVLESVLRMRMHLAGLTGYDTQALIRDLPGGHLRVDFCFPASGLVVEVDGARWHPDPGADRRRDNDLAALGWRVLRFTWVEVVQEHQRVLACLQAALSNATPSFHLTEGAEFRAA